MWRPAITLLAIFTLLTGVAYPLAVAGLGGALFPRQAGGDETLIGQPFDDPGYFWGRPSAAAWNASASTGSNLGPSNPALHRAVAERVARLGEGVPVDLVTTSGSGLDPHVSPAGARWQVDRVAAARGVDASVIRALVDAYVERPTLGVLGEARVNVLLLNRALDQRHPKRQ
jgi:potassium-transporting ATPase KdpC subunit